LALTLVRHFKKGNTYEKTYNLTTLVGLLLCVLASSFILTSVRAHTLTRIPLVLVTLAAAFGADVMMVMVAVQAIGVVAP